MVLYELQGYEVAMKQMSGGYSPVLAIECSTIDIAKLLPRKTRIFNNATSLGGVESLVTRK